jgi:hypothetical protein
MRPTPTLICKHTEAKMCLSLAPSLLTARSAVPSLHRRPPCAAPSAPPYAHTTCCYGSPSTPSCAAPELFSRSRRNLLGVEPHAHGVR